MTNSRIFINCDQLCNNFICQKCKTLLSVSLIPVDLVCTLQYLNTGAFNSFNHSLRFFCLVLFLCLSVSHIDVVPLPSHSQYLVSFSVSLSIFLCVYSSLAVCLWPSLMSTPWWSTGASLGKVSPPYCRTATVQLTRWLLSLSFFFPSRPILPCSLLIRSGSLHSTACFILPWLTLVLTGPSVDLNDWTQSYWSDHTFTHCYGTAHVSLSTVRSE